MDLVARACLGRFPALVHARGAGSACVRRHCFLAAAPPPITPAPPPPTPCLLLGGYNASASAGGPGDAALSVPLLAADAAALIDVLGGRVELVAHDWGGGIAWWAAAAWPSRVASLSIINMAHPMGWLEGVRGVEAQQRASAYVLEFIQPGFAAYLTADGCAQLQSWISSEAWWPALKPALLAAWGVPGSVDRGLGWYRENIHPAAPPSCTAWSCWRQGVAGAFDGMPNHGSVAVPTLVQWGMLDTAFASEWQLSFMPQKVANLTVLRYARNTHWLAQESPREVGDAIAQFVGARL